MNYTTNQEKQSARHTKSPSLRDIMLGKKTVKSLPDNFFEKVLELEIKLKKGFNINTLQELVNYYSVRKFFIIFLIINQCAIEYYESIEDPKFKDFQVSLNMLLSQPEILKKMSTLNKNGKVSGTIEEPSSYSSKYRKEQVKQQMKMKVDYAAHTQNRDHQVKTIMKEVEKKEVTQNIESIVNKDLTSQEENFKKRLEEKRKKNMLSTSDITEQIETIKNKRITLGGKNANKSLIIECIKKDHDNNNNITGDILNDIDNDGINVNVSFNNFDGGNDDTHPKDNFLQALDNSFDNHIDTKRKIEEFDGDISFDAPNMDTSGITSRKLKQQPRHKQIFNDLKLNMDSFLSEFNYYFFEEVFSNVVEEIQRILEEKHQKVLEISKNYNNQIKEYEFLITTGKYFFRL